MCGRFTLTVNNSENELAFPRFNFPNTLQARYNIAPGQDIPVVTNTGTNKLEHFRWGLIPSWARDPKVGVRMINARCETLSQKPSFSIAYKKHRCLIISDGFYEWKQDPTSKTKTPIYIRMKSEKPFAFAGLWAIWSKQNENPIFSCSIITTNPNQLMKKFHNRMPVIIPKESYDRWLSPKNRRANELNHLLCPYPETEMIAYPVSTIVNNPKTNSPACIKPFNPREKLYQATLF